MIVKKALPIVGQVLVPIFSYSYLIMLKLAQQYIVSHIDCQAHVNKTVNHACNRIIFIPLSLYTYKFN